MSSPIWGMVFGHKIVCEKEVLKELAEKILYEVFNSPQALLCHCFYDDKDFISNMGFENYEQALEWAKKKVVKYDDSTIIKCNESPPESTTSHV